VAGCTDVPTISDGVCGNGVVEPASGEDCDRPDAVCTPTCHFACDPSADCSQPGVDGTCCPDGFSCGANHECRAPGGTFDATDIAAPFDVQGFRVADLDGDHVADVLGVSTSSVKVRHGSPTSPLADLETRSSPFATGAIAIGDYTGDGRPDVLMPVAGGLMAFETSTGTAEPVTFPVEVDTAHSVIHARVAAATVAGQVEQIRLDYKNASQATDLVVEVVDHPEIPLHSQLPCGLTVTADRIRGRALHPYDDGGNGAHILVPIVFATDDDGLTPPQLCVDTIGGTGTSATGAATLRPALTGEAFFMPAVGCPDLVLPVLSGANPATLFIPHTGSAGACGVDVAGSVSMAIGVPLTPVTANGATALVTSSGIYSIANPAQCKTQPSQCLLTASTRTWEFASTGDFDGDGRQDFATGGQNEDVEIWMQQAAIAGKAQWLDRRLPTSGTAEILVTGDFDGDGLDDLAIASVDPVADRTAQITMAYGGPTGELDGPISAGTFVEFDSFAMAPLVDPSQPTGLDHADDLIIANGGDLDSTVDAKLTYIYGAGSRLPSAPWGYESTFGGSQSEHTAGWAAVIGRYGTNQTPGAFAAFTQSAGVQVLGGHDGVVVELTRTPDTFVPSTDKPIDSCESNTAFCAATAHYVSVPRDDGDLLLAFGAATDTSDCGAYYVATGGVPALTTIACASLAPGAAADAIKSITGITAATMIDGSTIAVAKLPRDSNDSLWLWTVSVVGGTPQLTQPIDLSAEIKKAMGLSEAHCMDATAIELGTRTVDGASYGDGREIVVSCRVPIASGFSTWLYARFTGASGSLIVPLLDVGADTYTDVEAGDVDGDGLPDLVYTTGSAGAGTIHAHVQCDIHRGCPIGANP